TVLAWLFRNSLPALLIAIPILFQPELRRTLERIGRVGIRGWIAPSPVEQTIDTVVKASLNLSQRRRGALMVLERSTGLQEYMANGVELDAAASIELLTGLFLPDSPLHDGAAIFRHGRIAACGCLLPLPQDSQTPSQWGTRHRAAIGITERSDAIAVVVSEETGRISLAKDGHLYTGLDEQTLRHRLTALLSINTNHGGWWWTRRKEQQ
ncbi:MAG: diadenylate cyclase, partial [Chloroflexi bacterium]|nr:diadenylate cyclase [Chloroflexota bacterium]